MAATPVALPTVSAQLGHNSSGASMGDTQERILTKTAIDHKTISSLLLSKMAAVLRDLEYRQQTIEKVAQLVVTNIVSAIDDKCGPVPDKSSLQNLIDQKLLDKENLLRRNLSLNSNEPVLILETPTNIGSPEGLEVKDVMLDTLRSRNIRPVRVYMRSAKEAGCLEFKAALLNVVNTDIGGPSMIQLLDAAFHDEDWKKDLVLKEAWNGDTLLWRDEAWPDLGFENVASIRQNTRSTSEPQDTITDPTPAIKEVDEPPDVEGKPTQSEAHRAAQNAPAYTDVSTIPEYEDEYELVVVEHPAMKELREREANRREIQHPTWPREDEDRGLLDIIASQSSSVKDNGPVSTIPWPPEDSADDFEIVNKE